MTRYGITPERSPATGIVVGLVTSSTTAVRRYAGLISEPILSELSSFFEKFRSEAVEKSLQVASCPGQDVDSVQPGRFLHSLSSDFARPQFQAPPTRRLYCGGQRLTPQTRSFPLTEP